MWNAREIGQPIKSGHVGQLQLEGRNKVMPVAGTVPPFDSQ